MLDDEPGWRSQYTTRLQPGRPTNPDPIPGGLREFSPAKCPDGLRGHPACNSLCRGDRPQKAKRMDCEDDH